MLPSVAGTRSVFAERTSGGYFLDFDWKRDELARYGLSIDDAQMVVMSAIGGDNVTTTDRGPRALPGQRALLPRLSQRPRPAPARAGAGRWTARCRSRSANWPTVKLVSGPAMLRNENGMLTGYVYVDVAGRDIGSYVAEAKRVVARARHAAAPATRSPGAASTRRWSACASG